MAKSTRVSLEEYFRTGQNFDYLDGLLGERNTGYREHARTLSELAGLLQERTSGLGIRVLTNAALDVGQSRIRMVDVCLLQASEGDKAPFSTVLCVELIGSAQTFRHVVKRVNDYLAMGVPLIWIIDPGNKEAWLVTREKGAQQVDELRWNDVVIQLSEILPE